jgi:hypothetical protein
MTGNPIPELGGMRPREALANWLLCAALNKASGASLMFTSDPTGGDGVIIDMDTRYEVALTEHVLAASSNDTSVEALVLNAVEEKRARGESYAGGKALIVYLAAQGEWRASVVARQLPDPLLFDDVYVVCREGIEAGAYDLWRRFPRSRRRQRSSLARTHREGLH